MMRMVVLIRFSLSPHIPIPSPVVIDMFGVIFDGTEDAAASTIGNIGTKSPAWIRMGPGMARGGWEGGSQFDNGNHLMEEGTGVCVNSTGMRILQCIRHNKLEQLKLMKGQLTFISSECLIRISSEYLPDIPLLGHRP